MRILLALLALLWALPALATPGVLTRETIVVGGVTRSYLLYEPSTRRPGQMMPLLLALHGGGQRAETFVAREVGGTTLVAQAEARGYVLIAPQGLGYEPAWRHTTDPSAMTAKAARVAGDDVALLAALQTRVAPGLGIDPNREYCVGVSAGGMMCYRAACERPGGMTFRAMGLVSTTLTLPRSACLYARGVSLIQIHGLQDRNVPYEGTDRSQPAPVYYPPVERGFNFFWRQNGCAAEVEAAPPAPDTREWAMACPGGVEMVLDQVADGTHGWFAAPSIDATARIFAFLAAHS